MRSLRVFKWGLRVGWEDFHVFYRDWRIWLVAWLLGAVTGAARYVLLGKLLGSRELLEFLLIGNAVAEGTRAVAWVCAASTWDRWSGTYPLLVIAPSGLWPALSGRTTIWFFNGVATSLATFGVLAMAFHLRLPMPRALLLPLAIGLTCASTYCFMLFLGAFIVRVPRLRNFVLSLSTTALTAFCGAAVPVSFWPRWVQVIVSVMPVTHGMQVVRFVLSDAGSTSKIWSSVAVEALVGFGWLACAILSIQWMADAGRADGSIDFVGA